MVPVATSISETSFTDSGLAESTTYYYTVSGVNASGPSPQTSEVSATTTGAQTLSKLVNISTRSSVGTATNVQIAGFVIQGAEAKTVLVRANGPSLGLAPFNLSGVLVDPVLKLYQGQTVIAENQGWSSGSTETTSALQNAFDSSGAFTWSAGGKDSALLVSLSPGAYTAIISGATGGTGIALVEVYEVGANQSHLVNISTRSPTGSGAAVQIAGFVIRGTQSKTVLIRASGPALAAAPFNLPGTLLDPVLSLYAGQTQIAQDTGWSSDGAAAVSAFKVAFTSSGAFSWPEGSVDAALLVTLAPGDYTAQVSSKSGGTGVTLVEVYEVP
jgi:hypothetical protein